MLSLVLAATLGASCCWPPAPTDPARAVMPPRIYGVVGTPLEVYLDNIVMSYQANGGPFTFNFTGPATATQSATKWSWTPSAAGTQPLDLVIQAPSGQPRGGGHSTLYVSDGAIAATKLVLVGDSLTDNSVYPPLIKALTDPNVTYLGSKSNGGVPNEGQAGKHWCFFDTDPTSIFMNSGVIDIPHWLGVIGATPDVIVVQLGVNNIFTSTLSGVDAAADLELACADDLIAKFKAAIPAVVIGLTLTTPGNKDDNSFFVNYSPPINTEWTQRQKFHRFVERMLAHWPGDGTSNIYLVPIDLAIDRVNGYPSDNAVHPQASGYSQIASQVYAWLAYVR